MLKKCLSTYAGQVHKYIKSADERLETYLGQLDNADRGEEAGTTRRSDALAAKIAKMREQRQVNQAMLEQLKASGESQISLTDPDARAMAAHPKVGVGYNAQIAVDAQHKLIVEQHVTNAGSDLGFLAETAGAAKDILGVERIDAVADMPVSSLSRGGYYMGEDIAACERAGITPYVARPQRGTAVGQGAVPLRRSCGLLSLPRRATARYTVPLASGRSYHRAISEPARLWRLRAQGPVRPRKLPPHHAVGRRGRA